MMKWSSIYMIEFRTRLTQLSVRQLIWFLKITSMEILTICLRKSMPNQCLSRLTIWNNIWLKIQMIRTIRNWMMLYKRIKNWQTCSISLMTIRKNWLFMFPSRFLIKILFLTYMTKESNTWTIIKNCLTTKKSLNKSMKNQKLKLRTFLKSSWKNPMIKDSTILWLM